MRNEEYYERSNKYVAESSFPDLQAERYFDVQLAGVSREDLFTLNEIEKIVKDLPNCKSPGIDGVKYEI